MSSRHFIIEVEVGSGFAFNIVEEVDGFWIDYDPEQFELHLGLKGWRPLKNDLRWLVGLIKKVMKDLDIRAPRHFALELVPIGMLGGWGNPSCCMDKRREVIYLRLAANVVEGHLAILSEYQGEYIFYHELMHAKDCLEGRFPSAGLFEDKNPELVLIESLFHFSIEGRLEKWDKPHEPREKTIENEYRWASELRGLKKTITKEFIRDLCDKLWGREVTFQEARSLSRDMMREPSYIRIWAEEHHPRGGDLHYHMDTNLGQKRVFKRFEKKLVEMLPEGFTKRYYFIGTDDIGVIDKKGRQHMHIYYRQRRFPHNLHITFLRPTFRPVFLEMLRKCFPKAKITLEELEGAKPNFDGRRFPLKTGSG
ncbi:hypothetical protein ES703_00782 [subsurface metagenome]